MLVDRLAHERFLVEDVNEPREDRVFKRLGGEAIGVAVLGAVALPGEADVVGVASAVAVCGGAEVALAAAGAGDQAREQVVGLV